MRIAASRLPPSPHSYGSDYLYARGARKYDMFRSLAFQRTERLPHAQHARPCPALTRYTPKYFLLACFREELTCRYTLQHQQKKTWACLSCSATFDNPTRTGRALSGRQRGYESQKQPTPPHKEDGAPLYGRKGGRERGVEGQVDVTGGTLRRWCCTPQKRSSTLITRKSISWSLYSRLKLHLEPHLFTPRAATAAARIIVEGVLAPVFVQKETRYLRRTKREV